MINDRITLNDNQDNHARSIGVARRTKAVEVSRADKYSYKGSDLIKLEMDIESCRAEKAASIMLNKEWYDEILDDLSVKVPDLLPNIDVKSTSLYTGSLIIHTDTPDDFRYVLLIGRERKWELHGWLWGYEAKQKRFWRTQGVRHQAYFVPQSALNNDYTSF